MLAGFVNRYVARVMVRPEIASPADLRGKPAGIVRLGAAADRGLRSVFLLTGFEPGQRFDIFTGAWRRAGAYYRSIGKFHRRQP